MTNNSFVMADSVDKLYWNKSINQYGMTSQLHTHLSRLTRNLLSGSVHCVLQGVAGTSHNIILV